MANNVPAVTTFRGARAAERLSNCRVSGFLAVTVLLGDVLPYYIFLILLLRRCYSFRV